MYLADVSWVIVAGGTAVGLALVVAGLVLILRERVQQREAAWEEYRRREKERVEADRLVVAQVVEEDKEQDAPCTRPEQGCSVHDLGNVEQSVGEGSVATAPVEAVCETEVVQKEERDDEGEEMLFVVEVEEVEPVDTEMKPAGTGVRRRRRERMEQLLLWPDADLPAEKVGEESSRNDAATQR